MRSANCANAKCGAVFELARGRGSKHHQYCCSKCQRAAASRRHYVRSPEKVNAVAERRRDRLLRAPREAILAAQGGVCAICGTEKPGGRYSEWALDHDHRFKQTDPRGHRGVLCHGCNAALGRFGDTLKGLGRAVAYLEQFEKVVGLRRVS